MKFEYMETGGRKFLAARGEINCPGYMTEMIMRNMPRCIVPFNLIGNEAFTKILYETDTQRPIKDYLMENGADERWIKNFLISADGLLGICGEYLIDPDFMMMDTGSVFYSVDAGCISFILNPFEKGDFRGACKKLLADIAGNYFIDHAVSGEVFRERFLREVNKKDFNIRNLLSRWDDFSYGPNKEPVRVKQNRVEKPVKKEGLIKEILGKFSKNEETNETMAIANNTGHMCLTGICSINTRIPIREEGVTVGRTMLQKDYGLNNNGIGKMHARIYKQDGNVYATDLGSKNGTYLNGEQLDKRVPAKMERGDILAFSDEEFILC